MSDAAKTFYGSIIRHVLTGVAGILVAHGYVTKVGADAYTEELVGTALWAAPVVWANRVHYWEMIRTAVASSLPSGSNSADVTDKVATMKAAGTLPALS